MEKIYQIELDLYKHNCKTYPHYYIGDEHKNILLMLLKRDITGIIKAEISLFYGKNLVSKKECMVVDQNDGLIKYTFSGDEILGPGVYRCNLSIIDTVGKTTYPGFKVRFIKTSCNTSSVLDDIYERLHELEQQILDIETGSIDITIHWGEIEGTISNQTDLNTILENLDISIQDIYLQISQLETSFVWGNIQGNIDNQTDLKNALDDINTQINNIQTQANDLQTQINNMISDSSTTTNKTWSSSKINTLLNTLESEIEACAGGLNVIGTIQEDTQDVTDTLLDQFVQTQTGRASKNNDTVRDLDDIVWVKTDQPNEHWVKFGKQSSVSVDNTTIVKDITGTISVAGAITDEIDETKQQVAINTAKLATIQEGAEVNVQPDYKQLDSSKDDYIKNLDRPGYIYSSNINTVQSFLIDRVSFFLEYNSSNVCYEIKIKNARDTYVVVNNFVCETLISGQNTITTNSTISINAGSTSILKTDLVPSSGSGTSPCRVRLNFVLGYATQFSWVIDWNILLYRTATVQVYYYSTLRKMDNVTFNPFY